MRLIKGDVFSAAHVIVLSLTLNSWAETSQVHPIAKPLADFVSGQQMLELPVHVVDAEGKPVANAKVTPWALRSSQGHGLWSKDDDRAGVGPQEVFTEENGAAIVLYPHYRDLNEQTHTISVSLYVDHPDFAFVDGLHIDVPLDTKGPYEIKLAAGVPLEVRPLINGQPADLANLFALWSDGRSWQPGSAPAKTAQETLQFPALRAGANSVLLVKLDGDRATDFSKITDVELKPGEPAKVDVALRPALRIAGVLSDNVPRPVTHGRIKLETLAPNATDNNRVGWFSWVPIQSDGTFTIDGWPADEPLQLIALCDGYMAASGKAPRVVENPRDPAEDPFGRPQVFDPSKTERIEVVMTPLAHCVATAVDEGDQPIAGVKVVSWPNVQWWNNGSQIYCAPLARAEQLLRDRTYENAIEKAFPAPFEAETDVHGKATLDLPAGNERLAIDSDVYELPIFLGQRDVRVKLTHGETTEALLRLQPRGTEKLGEWDKLAGVAFGCTTREGRQICALPGVRSKMDEFTKRFREAKDQHDPQLLSEAYTAVADAFAGVGDQEEAAKWRQKAADQAAKAKTDQRPPSN